MWLYQFIKDPIELYGHFAIVVLVENSYDFPNSNDPDIIYSIWN